MAAYPALVSLNRLIDQLLHYDKNNFHIPEINDSVEIQILQSLQEKLCLLLDFLENHSLSSNETVSMLAGRIRDVAYHVEDLIESSISDYDDDFQSHKSRRTSRGSLSTRDQIPSKYEEDDKWQGMKRAFWEWVKALFPQKQSEKDTTGLTVRLFNDKIEDWEKIIEEIDFILEETEKIDLSSSTTEDMRPIQNSSRLEAVSSNKVVGFDDDSTKIKDWLCGESSRLQIISIVGMGGSGKTTLAKNIFDDSLVEYHFHKRAWVTISQEYCLREILLGLLNCLVEKTEDLSQKSDGTLEEKIYKSLKGRRYLIVMDDLWGPNVWDDLRMILPDDCNGSRVVLTTRLNDVADYVDSSRSHCHEMQSLDGDKSWNLLKEKVFAEENCPQELEIIGKRKIVSKCGGLPLALVLAAGLLKKVDRTQNEWEKFAESISSTLASDDEHFLKIMSLSYDHLPHHLKPCFLYIGGFPEDYTIPVFKLLQLWIAEGFVRPNESKSSEQVAEEYLKDLARRNLVLITKSSTGKFRFCRIHDLLRDFCIHKAQDENLFHVNKHLVRRETENKRRLFLSRQNTWHLFKLLGNMSSLHVRSIIFSTHYFKTELPSLVAASKLLRVFEGLEVEMSMSTIDEVTELCHLRYLSFTLPPSEKFLLPTSISRLRNLHTIIIQGSPTVSLPHIHLPFEIWIMPQLRHVIVHNSCFLPKPRFGKKASVLENLQTLSRILDFTFKRKYIEMIPNLKNLGIIYTEWYSSRKNSKYRLNNLLNLHQLESLKLRIQSIEHNGFPVDISFPSKLKKLSLYGCTLPWQKMTVIGSLPNLEVLKLRFNAFRGEEWVTNDDEFPSLKFLLMDSISLVCWRAESSNLPSLKRLIIRNCPYLQEVPSDIGYISTLKLIEVGPKSKLAADSAKRIQEEQEEMGNDSLQVRVIHH